MGHLAPEDIKFIPAVDSPSRKPLLMVTQEASHHQFGPCVGQPLWEKVEDNTLLSLVGGVYK